MKLEVIIGNNDLKKGRLFNTYNEATFYLQYQEMIAKLYLKEEELGKKIETQPINRDELIRKVYQNPKGKKRFYIVKLIN